MVTTMLHQYILLTRLNKPIGIFLLLWPTLIALWLANNGNIPDSKILFIFIFGVIIMRTAGCIANDIADRNFDNQVERTKFRPLATGKISVFSAYVLLLFLLLIAGFLVLNLNQLTIMLAAGGLIIAVIYPLMKRITYYPQVVLGLAFAWPVPMAYAAQLNTLPIFEVTILVLALACWIIAFDTQYAMVDKKDDLRIGIKSTAIKFGNFDKLIIVILQTSFIMLLAVFGWYKKLSYSFYLGLFIASLVFCYQYWLIRERKPALCFRAFLVNNYVGMAVFFGPNCSLM